MTTPDLDTFPSTPRPLPSHDRFVARKAPEVGDSDTNAWVVQDMEAERFHLPRYTIAFRMRHAAAVRIAIIMSEEWRAFLANPT